MEGSRPAHIGKKPSGSTATPTTKSAPPGIKLPKLYIENCEGHSQWLMLEYLHCIDSWEDIEFTNVTDPKLRDALAKRARVHRSSLADLKDFDPRKTIVLDPAAPKAFETADADRYEALVVGGILGSEGFTGKTGRLLTGKLGCEARNLGKVQLSIDSAVVVCRLIALGMKHGDIKLSTELEILHDDGGSSVLPYGYPVLNGKIIFTPGLMEYLRKH